METKNILIVGVGGQGSLLASRILGDLFAEMGAEVKVSEVHGMSQRGGSVVTYIRAGERIDSPLVTPGEADIIIAFEELEALRWVNQLKKGGTIIYSTQRISPMPVITGAAEYPDGIADKLTAAGVKTIELDALALAVKAGSEKAANVVLLGRASKVIGGTGEQWERALTLAIPAKFLEMNMRAFKNGLEA